MCDGTPECQCMSCMMGETDMDDYSDDSLEDVTPETYYDESDGFGNSYAVR